MVAFTEDGEGKVWKYVQDERIRDIVEVRRADATLRDLKRAQSEASDMVADLGFLIASSINVFENRVELYATNRTALEDALREDGKSLPAHVVILGP